ncbi:hypothetical protein [Glacieibacterium frigidum]|uniref:Molecular chaperone DnaJ n=1 Tax=Glacieibacterium frigidum TaxID=2593303 RepID=A0A552UJ72_9SPHN|nr:hypothetical protein [Glacieibacterium frigidum]TRW18235.1 hypothetical protein FMM06_09095 [Glacieibacterium frigidum]
MILAAIAVLGLAWWLHSKGELMPALKRWGAVAALALLAARFLETGRWPLALAAAGAAAWWWYAARDRTREVGSTREALTVLGLTGDPGPAEIHAAWRRALATAHPDAGGSDAATQRATAARDLLLAELANRPPSR